MLYWGLDYPPLTAYHSYLTGLVAQRINPAFVELFTSRGYESPSHQFFMRMSVLISDCLIFVTGLYYYTKTSKLSNKNQWVFFALCSYPGITLIDYGHFQYNCVSLGLALWAIAFLSQGRNILGAIAFSAALNFKQMELYHALPIFFYLLAACNKKPKLTGKLSSLVQIGIATLLTFGLIWLPFLQWHDGLLQQVIISIFPFNRGIFEDYVANFWCTFNVFIKIRQLMETTTLAHCCLILTALFSFPSSLHLFLKSSPRNLLLCLINVSLAFFLFSYHVHEKSILLVSLPISLISSHLPWTAFWFHCVSHFSMLPLYAKDGLLIPALAVLVLYSLFAYSSLDLEELSRQSITSKLSATVSLVGCSLLTVLFLTCPTPAAYPYLWTLFVSVWSCLHYFAFLFYFLRMQFWLGPQSLKVKLN